MKTYLDVCCLNRPFDDSTEFRVESEASAVERLFDLIDRGTISYHSSDMAVVEIERMADLDKKKSVRALLPVPSHIHRLTTAMLDDAENLTSRGFGVADAVHRAASARLGVDASVTTDDRLVRRARKHATLVGVRVCGPIELLSELDDAFDD